MFGRVVVTGMQLTRSSKADARQIAALGVFPSWLNAVAIVTALLLIFELDRLTVSAPVQHLYYLPIILAGIAFGLRGSLTAALAAIVLYHLANPHLLTFKYDESDFVQVSLFIAVGVITAKLTKDAERLRVLASTDDLTGLHNLRSFESRLHAMIAASRESGTPVSLLVFDVDRLKSLNDRYGHLVGAEAVRTVGHVVSAQLPPEAVASRYGGDEFVVALPNCRENRAREIADGLRAAVSGTAPVLAGQAFPAATLSISIGFACAVFDAQPGGEDRWGETLFRAADAALYRAKDGGRDQVSA
jgi:diguanylate cyclase (GGDEF)-like protein